MKKKIFALLLTLALPALAACGSGTTAGSRSDGPTAPELRANRYVEVSFSFQGDTFEETGDSLILYEDGRGVLDSFYAGNADQNVVFDPDAMRLYTIAGINSYKIDLEGDFVTVHIEEGALELFELDGEAAFSLEELDVDAQALLTQLRSEAYAASAPQAGEDGWIHISTPEEFLHIADDLSGKYVLDEDIDDWWGGESTVFTPIGTPDEPFTGELDGNGHKLTGTLAYTGRDEAWGLFGCNEGSIHDLTLGYISSVEMFDRYTQYWEEGFTYASLEDPGLPTDQTRCFGVLCGLNCGTISNIRFEDRTNVPDLCLFPNSNDKIYAGIICGYNDGAVSGVELHTTGLTLFTLDKNTPLDIAVVCGYQTAGGVLEDVRLKLDNHVNMRGFGGVKQIVSPAIYAGLLVGEAEGGTTIRGNIYAEDGYVDVGAPLVGADVRIGSLVGYVSGDIELSGIEIAGMRVYMDAQGPSYMEGQGYSPEPGGVHSVSGLIGWADGSVTLSDIALHDVSAQAVRRPGGDPQATSVGGFVGHCGGSFTGRTLTWDGGYSSVDASVEQGVAYAGGFCGYCAGAADIADSSINVSMNPIFHGSVLYESNVIGYLCGNGTFDLMVVTCELDDNGESMGHMIAADSNSTYYLASFAGYAEGSVKVSNSFSDVEYTLLGRPGAYYYDESREGVYNG